MSLRLAASSIISAKNQVQAQRIIYVRNGGSDTNTGDSVGNALLTLAEAANRLHMSPTGMYRQVINLTGFVDTLATATQIDTPFGKSQKNNSGRAGAFDNGKADIFNFPLELLADPLLVQAITVTGEVADPTTGLVVLSVSDVLTPAAHVGEWVDGGPGARGVIHSNTSGTITVADGVGFASGSNIYTQSCVLTGDVNGALRIICNGDVLIGGIKLVSSIGQTMLNMKIAGRCYINQCNIIGVEQSRAFPGFGLIECWFSYLYGNLRVEGAANTLGFCVVNAANLDMHGSGGGGANTMTNTIFDGCTAIGDGNYESAVDVEIDKCWIMNGSGAGVSIVSPYRCRVSDCRIDDCADSAIVRGCGGGSLKIRNCIGTGNVGYGLVLLNGAQALSENTLSTIAGTLGDVLLGIKPVTWAAVAAAQALSDSINDIDQADKSPLCRIY